MTHQSKIANQIFPERPGSKAYQEKDTTTSRNMI